MHFFFFFIWRLLPVYLPFLRSQGAKSPHQKALTGHMHKGLCFPRGPKSPRGCQLGAEAGGLIPGRPVGAPNVERAQLILPLPFLRSDLVMNDSEGNPLLGGEKSHT